MLFGLASYPTAFDTYYALLRFGYDFTNERQVFTGPKVGAIWNERTDQARICVHVSDIPVGPTKLTVTTGYMNEHDEGSCWYGTANLDFRI